MRRLSPWIGSAALMSACLGLACAGPAGAHHSLTIFDRTREVTLRGVVTDFEWSSPHAVIEVRLPSRDGEIRNYEVECASPAVLSRIGWSRTSLKRGDQVVVQVHPQRGGDPIGRLARLTLADGRTLVDND